MVSKTWEMWTLSKEDIDNVAEERHMLLVFGDRIVTGWDYDEIAKLAKKEISAALDNWKEIIEDAIIEHQKRQR